MQPGGPVCGLPSALSHHFAPNQTEFTPEVKMLVDVAARALEDRPDVHVVFDAFAEIDEDPGVAFERGEGVRAYVARAYPKLAGRVHVRSFAPIAKDARLRGGKRNLVGLLILSAELDRLVAGAK